ncbi:Cyclin-B2-1 [Echinococcus granulosus]|uniref:Cyclin-B2-1 n=1 Tax=Echinococcus granulosus TaxID=6210 RepID=W6U1Y9_ECHGR|nr:Cyclin-B2-1 [Echinococcus granulosus]EUB55058.1 Cyclin-B2-1 [Echinococcus granulosus]
MMGMQNYPNQRYCVDPQGAPTPQIGAWSTPMPGVGYNSLQQACVPSIGNYQNMRPCNGMQENIPTMGNMEDQIQCNMQRAREQMRELCNNDGLMDKTVQEDLKTMEETLSSMQAPCNTQPQDFLIKERCGYTQPQNLSMQGPYRNSQDDELTERILRYTGGCINTQSLDMSIQVYRYTAGYYGPQTQYFSMQDAQYTQSCDNIQPRDLSVQMNYGSTQPVDLAPPRYNEDTQPPTLMAQLCKYAQCISKEWRQPSPPRRNYVEPVRLPEIPNGYNYVQSQNCPHGPKCPTNNSFGHQSNKQCNNSSPEKNCDNVKAKNVCDGGHNENNNASCSVQQNDDEQQPEAPQNDATACGGITDVDRDAIMAAHDAQCVEKYAVALRFFSYSMGQTYIDPSILEKRPENEILERLKEYQRHVLDQLEKDNRQMRYYDPEFLVRTDVTADMRSKAFNWLIELQECVALLDEDVHVVTTIVDLVTCKTLIMAKDYPLLFVTAIWCARLRSRSEDALLLEDLLQVFNNRYTESQVNALGQRVRSCIETLMPVVTPWHFYDLYSVGSIDIPRKQYLVYDDACNYLFDLGLTEEILVQYSANLRCCAVIYLIRRILRLHCAFLPDHEVYHTQRTRCPCCTLAGWSELLAVMTGFEEGPLLKKVAYIYCMILCRARNFVIDPEHAHVYRAAFDKYNTSEFRYVASNSLLTHFRMHEVFPAATR